MKQHPRRRSKRRTPAPTLHDLLRQPDADFYRLPDLEIRSGRIVTDGCRRVLDFAPQKITLDVGSTVITAGSVAAFRHSACFFLSNLAGIPKSPFNIALSPPGC